MGVFARLLRRSKTTEDAVTEEVTPEAIPVADEVPADGDVPADGGVPAADEAPAAVAGPVADEAVPATGAEAGAEEGSAVDAPASVSTEAPAPAPAEASEAEPDENEAAAEPEADSAGADGVEIPRQQSADEAADRETDEGART